ncbi:MAG: 4'-phosphopantetheinyl transferase superfamily protein [archaeon]|nr:4'-phosphopantetheinyl transferase superfamily protein [archaeon]
MTVTTYYADAGTLGDPALFEKLYREQPQYRRKKIDGFRFMKDRVLSIGAGALLQRVLDIHDVREREPVFGPYGKPSIGEIHFNLSHSGERVMCTVSDAEVGCDVEMVTDIDLEIARRYFFGTEYRSIIDSGDGDARKDTFFRLWTLKESFMKATGLGFQIPLDSFCVSLDDTVTVEQHVDDREYFLREFRVESGYRYACCSLDPDIDEHMIPISLV